MPYLKLKPKLFVLPALAIFMVAEAQDFVPTAKVGGFVQAQAQTWISDDQPNNWNLRRLHIDAAGRAAERVEFRAHMNVASGTADVLDAYLDWTLRPDLRVRAGKLKPPTGPERLLPYTRVSFVELSFVTMLQPIRDVGVMVHGVRGAGVVEYQAALVNGAPDGKNNGSENTRDKDVHARVFVRPFAANKKAAEGLRGVGFGLSGSFGHQVQEASTLPVLSTGRQVFHRYGDSVRSVGTVVRLNPQGTYYYGPFGLMAEYAHNVQSLTRSGYARDITTAAYAVHASWFLTGEKNGYGRFAVLKPNGFPTNRDVGAIELLARVHGIAIDKAAQAALDAGDLTVRFSDPARAARAAFGLAAGARWHLSNRVNMLAAYDYTTFTGGAGIASTANTAPVVANRPVEQLVTLAVETAF